eukprot:TRINITY_DN12335_c0_g1_i3.p1 TRINITY_DN12335_c0_g1~~TRINITY_DN12335_c0_g1_i3.p1  ORF type:complete len:188 (+),score=19.01 TRINITY_DN12335_c0_g1_i3:34-597(+)
MFSQGTTCASESYILPHKYSPPTRQKNIFTQPSLQYFWGKQGVVTRKRTRENEGDQRNTLQRTSSQAAICGYLWQSPPLVILQEISRYLDRPSHVATMRCVCRDWAYVIDEAHPVLRALAQINSHYKAIEDATQSLFHRAHFGLLEQHFPFMERITQRSQEHTASLRQLTERPQPHLPSNPEKGHHC